MMRRIGVPTLLVVLAAALSGCGAVSSHPSVQTRPSGITQAPLQTAPPCLPSGTEVQINAALTGPDAVVRLCPNAVFTLAAPVKFNASGQRLETEGQPTDGTRAMLRVAGVNLTSAINGVDRSGIVIRNLSIDGAAPQLGAHQGDALIEIGGNASDQVVEYVDAHDTRSWSTLHLAEGQVSNNVPTCQGDQVTHNTFGPAGTPDNNWADGISLACGHATVADNTVTDATDGAIVIFGAPGSTVHGNTIVAASRTLLGAINMVDIAPVGGNYAGTVVSDNVINAQGALIKVGVAMGPRVWTCVAGTATGGTVTGNTLQGAHMGYGFAVNGVANWTVTGNVDNSTHVGIVGPACGGPVSPPQGFQFQEASTSVLQPQFVGGQLTYLLGLHT